MGCFQKVAVTGASGFLGSALVAELEASGMDVLPISRSAGFDLSDAETLDRLPECDAVFHLAAKVFVPASFEDPRGFMAQNAMLTLNAMDLCRRWNAPMLMASSYVYGPPKKLPVDETHPVQSWNPYAASKLLSEETARCFAGPFDIPVRIFRIFNIFGSGQDPRFLIPKIIQGLKNGKLALENPKPRRDFLHVSDAARAMVSGLSTTWSGTQVFNVGSGESHSVTDVVSCAADLLGADEKLVAYSDTERATEIDDVIADISFIKAELGWSPRLTFVEGMEQTIGLSV